MLKEISSELNVSIHTVWHTLKVLGYTAVKKTARYKEHENYVKWTRSYLKKLERFKRKNHDIIYMDKTGFALGTSSSARLWNCWQATFMAMLTVQNARAFLSLEAI